MADRSDQAPPPAIASRYLPGDTFVNANDPSACGDIDGGETAVAAMAGTALSVRRSFVASGGVWDPRNAIRPDTEVPGKKQQ